MKRLAMRGAAPHRPLLPIALMLPTVLVGGLLSGCSNNPAKKVAVRINKDTVTEDEFLERVQGVSIADLAPSYQQRGPAKAGEYAMFQTILEKLLEQLAAEKGVKPTDAQINDYVAYAKKSFANPNGAALTLMQQNPFRSDADWKRDAKVALIQRGLAVAPLKISPEDQKRKFDEVKSMLTPADKYHLRILDSTTEAKANQALDALKKGVAFETVALQNSNSVSPGSKDGDIGVIDATSLPPAWLDAIKDLKPNEYTKKVIKLDPASRNMATPGAQPQIHYYLLQVIEKLPGKAPTQEESKYAIELALISEKDPQFFQRIAGDIDAFKQKADIQVNLPAYKDLLKKMMTPSGGQPGTTAPGTGTPGAGAQGGPPPTGATTPPK